MESKNYPTPGPTISEVKDQFKNLAQNQKKTPADTRETVGGSCKLNGQPLPQPDIQRVGC